MAEEHDHVYRLTPEFGDFKRQLSSLKSAMSGALKVAGGLSAAALSLGAGFKSLADDVFGVVDQVNTLAKGSGLAADTVNGLRRAAKAANKDVKDLVPKNLAKNMLAAADGSKTMENAFSRLGVAVTDETGALRDADAVFRESIDALTKHESATEAAGLAAQIMGKQGRELLSAFEGSEGLDHFVDVSRQFGIQVGPDAIDASNAWWAATSNLSLAFEHAQGILATELGPAASKFVNSFALGFVFLTESTEHFFGLWKQEMAEFGRGLKALAGGDFSALTTIFQGPSVAIDNLNDSLRHGRVQAFHFWEGMQDGSDTATESIRQATVATTRYEAAIRDTTAAEKERAKAEREAEKERIRAEKEARKRLEKEQREQEKAREAYVQFQKDVTELAKRWEEARRDLLRDSWDEVKDNIMAGASEVGAALQELAGKDAERLKEVRKQAVLNRRMTDENNEAAMAAAQADIDAIDKQIKKRQNAARLGFALEQSAALAEIFMSSAVATMAMIPAFAFLGPGAIPAALAAVAPVAAAQTALVLSQKPPTFHDGGAVKPAPDEFFFGGNLARFGEQLMVANQRQAEILDQGNRTGMVGSMGETKLVMANAGRAFAEAVLHDIRSPGSDLAQAFGVPTGQVSVWGR